MAAGRWQVLIADLRGSRGVAPAQREHVDRALRHAIVAARRRFGSGIRSGPEILKGDELQAILRPEVRALSLLTYLRAQFAVGVESQLDLRAGLGRGRIERLSPRGPFASDGEAFHRARGALESVRQAGGGRRTGWEVGDPTFGGVAAHVLRPPYALWRRWTSAQGEASTV